MNVTNIYLILSDFFEISFIFHFCLGLTTTNTLSDVSSPLNLWLQESQILDGGSVFHCVAGVKKKVLPTLERDLDAQINTVREAERKKKKEEETKKQAEEETKKEKSKGWRLVWSSSLFPTVNLFSFS